MANLDGPNRLLNSAEVGELLGLPERTIRAEWKRWGLQAYRVGLIFGVQHADRIDWRLREVPTMTWRALRRRSMLRLPICP
jgi:hypothetical protein